MSHILLTNDDGHATDGLAALRAALLDAGHRVTTVAPETNRSGAARRVTCHGTVDVRRAGGTDDDPVLACSGTPVDCVRLGLFAAGLSPVDAVVSGINHGVNLGDDATYSGTVGAALEAALHGVPAIAFSQQDVSGDVSMVSTAPHRFDLAWWAPRFVDAVLAAPPRRRLAYSVNFPASRDLPDVEVTRLARVAYDEDWIEPVSADGEPSSHHVYLRPDRPPRFEAEPGTDVAALLRGRISVTPISADWTVGDHDVPRPAVSSRYPT